MIWVNLNMIRFDNLSLANIIHVKTDSENYGIKEVEEFAYAEISLVFKI